MNDCQDQDVGPRKFHELLLYLAKGLQSQRYAGATKLNKVLFLAEAEHYRRTGRTITGERYFKRENGPAPHQLRPARQELIDTGQAKLVQVSVGPGIEDEERLVPLREPDTSVFEVEELRVVNEILEIFADWTGRQLTDASHREFSWKAVAMNEEIPFSATLIDLTAEIPDDTTKRILEAARNARAAR